MAQALHMGGEVHNRNAVTIGLLIKCLLPALLAYSLPQEHVQRVAVLITGSDHFLLNLSMAAYKAMMDAAASVPLSSMATVMACNGVSFDIRLSSVGDHWFQAPVNAVENLFFLGFGADNTAVDLDNSAITETVGMGGFAMASFPATVKFVGGTSADAINNGRQMQVVTLDSNPTFTLPALNLAPTVTGTGARKVTDRGILPVIGTGVAYKQAEVRQIGIEITTAPMACFVVTVRALAEIVTEENHHG